MGVYETLNQKVIGPLRQWAIRNIPEDWVKSSKVYLNKVEAHRKQLDAYDKERKEFIEQLHGERTRAYKEAEAKFDKQLTQRLSLATQTISELTQEKDLLILGLEKIRGQYLDVKINSNSLRSRIRSLEHKISIYSRLEALHREHVGLVLVGRPSELSLTVSDKEVINKLNKSLLSAAKTYREKAIAECEARDSLEQRLAAYERNLLELSHEALIGAAELSHAPYALFSTEPEKKLLYSTLRFNRIMRVTDHSNRSFDDFGQRLGISDVEAVLKQVDNEESHKLPINIDYEDKIINLIPFANRSGKYIAFGISVVPKHKGVRRKRKRVYLKYRRSSEKLLEQMINTWESIKSRFSLHFPEDLAAKSKPT
ncbi:MAG: hypothetical protein AABX90_00890 [Nanoarchaeota archaeon]